MRISDWSSDVCSSDLGVRAGFFRGLDVVDRDAGVVRARAREHEHPAPRLIGAGAHDAKVFVLRHRRRLAGGAARHQRRRSFGDLPFDEIAKGFLREIDRKSVVEGKSVSVRVDLGGRLIIKKKKKTKTE